MIMEKNSYGTNLSTNEKVMMGFVRVAEIYKRAQSTIFRNYGLSFPQYNILRVLEVSDNGQANISKVSKTMLVPNANMTGIAKRLEKNGFIIRKSDPKDERITILEITPKSKKVLKNIYKENVTCLDTILKGFSEVEKNQLLEHIKNLINNGLPT